MVSDKSANRFVSRRDLIHLAILLSVASGIGAYLIATTVLIAKDGVFYIDLARRLSVSPVQVIKDHPFGYPFLVFVTHKVVSFLGDSSSLYSWIHSAQYVSLLCRVLALVPLYFIGRLLVGSYHAFWALLILVFLPYPAQYGSDALREWPHMLFLSCGFLAILSAMRKPKWMLFFSAGVFSGLGYLIRPVCAQLVVYGLAWLGYCFSKPSETMGRDKTAAAAIALLLGFLIPAGPHMAAKGTITPAKVRQLMSCSGGAGSAESGEPGLVREDAYPAYSAGWSATFANGLHEILNAIGENLLWVFAVPWLIGIFHYFRVAESGKEKYMIAAFTALNTIFLILHAAGIRTGVSRRYLLPLVCITSFYISTGLATLILHVTGEKPRGIALSPKGQIWFYVLIATGLAVCGPKLFRPIGIDKNHYRDLANWLNKNTLEGTQIAVPDKRISFYAERQGLAYEENVLPQTRYVVEIFRGKGVIPVDVEIPGAKRVFSVASNDGLSEAVMYDFGNSISESVSFGSYRCEKVADEKYRFYFLFEVKNGFAEDWVIYFHGFVRDENVVMLPKSRQKYRFDNWDFYPEPPTSAWPKNESVTIAREISAKPIPYNFKLGFYTAKAGQHGRQINIGWVNLADMKQRSNR